VLLSVEGAALLLIDFQQRLMPAICDSEARQHSVEIVTSEMVLFEWLRDSRHSKFREVQKLLK